MSLTCNHDRTSDVLDINTTSTVSKTLDCETLEVHYFGSIQPNAVDRSDEFYLLDITNTESPSVSSTTSSKPNDGHSSTTTQGSTTTKSAGRTISSFSIIALILRFISS